MHSSLRARFGRWRTWGGTTLGHGGFYGPGRLTEVESGTWLPLQEHEHKHVEQYEASMQRALLVGLVVGVELLALGHPVAALSTFLSMWWAGYLLMGAAGWSTAWLRGEDPYRGSHFEEGAYDADAAYEHDQRVH